MHALAATVWDIVKKTFAQWQSHRSAEMASALAFYGALALAGLALIGLYIAGAVFGRGGARAHVAGQAGQIAGAHNGQVLDAVLHAAATGRYAWIALAVGIFAFVLAVLATALQLQRALDAVWDVKPKSGQSHAAREAGHHALQFAAIYGLTLLLMCLLFAGGALHALTSHTHALPIFTGVLYQALDIGASIALLTCVFLFMFAYLPPAGISWRNVWLGSFISAVLYERGQFALALYLGQMEAQSPYADAGALLAVLLWLYYSAQVVLAGAIVTKVLKERADERTSARNKAA